MVKAKYGKKISLEEDDSTSMSSDDISLTEISVKEMSEPEEYYTDYDDYKTEELQIRRRPTLNYPMPVPPWPTKRYKQQEQQPCTSCQSIIEKCYRRRRERKNTHKREIERITKEIKNRQTVGFIGPVITPYEVTMKLGSTILRVIIDTGSAITLLKSCFLTEEQLSNLKPVVVSYQTITGETLRILGNIELDVEIEGQKLLVKFHIIQDMVTDCVAGIDALDIEDMIERHVQEKELRNIARVGHDFAFGIEPDEYMKSIIDQLPIVLTLQDDVGDTPLNNALLKGNFNQAEYILEVLRLKFKWALDLANNSGHTALILAPACGISVTLLHQLLMAGCDICKTDYNGHTALHSAITYKETELLIELVEFAKTHQLIEVFERNEVALYSPLQDAVLSGYPEGVRIIVNALTSIHEGSVNLDELDQSGQYTTLQLAQYLPDKKDREEIIQILTETISTTSKGIKEEDKSEKEESEKLQRKGTRERKTTNIGIVSTIVIISLLLLMITEGTEAKNSFEITVPLLIINHVNLLKVWVDASPPTELPIIKGEKCKNKEHCLQLTRIGQHQFHIQQIGLKISVQFDRIKFQQLLGQYKYNMIQVKCPVRGSDLKIKLSHAKEVYQILRRREKEVECRIKEPDTNLPFVIKYVEHGNVKKVSVKEITLTIKTRRHPFALEYGILKLTGPLITKGNIPITYRTFKGKHAYLGGLETRVDIYDESICITPNPNLEGIIKITIASSGSS